METTKRCGRPPKMALPKEVEIEVELPVSLLPRRKVFICSPLKGSIKRNLARATFYCRTAFDMGYLPWAPHLYYGQFLDDSSAFERAAGMRYGQETMWTVKEIWVCGEIITSGMAEEIKLAKQLEIPIRRFDENMEEIYD